LNRLLDLYIRRVWHPGKWRVARWLRLHGERHGDGGDLEVVRAGLRWRLDPSDAVAQDLYWCGVKDQWELYHIRRLLPRDGTVIDAGANFGYYACVLGSHLDGVGRVYAFEPFPGTFERLKTNIKLNVLSEKVIAVPRGLSDHAGSCGMQTDNTNSGAHYLIDGKGAIEITTLDAFCADHRLQRLDFLKIDVEGLEMAVLRGGREVIRQHRPMLQVEVHPVTLQRQGGSPSQLIELLQALGYSVNRIARRRLIPLASGYPIDGYFNVLCLPEEAAKS